MGKEVSSSRYQKRDFAAFESRLREETELLAAYFAGGRLSARQAVGGFELESWLIDAGGRAAPVNAAFLAALDDPLVVPELARFNVEINGRARPLTGDMLGAMHAALVDTWARCNATAAPLGAGLLMIGILPTATEQDFTLDHMSDMTRYRALNEQILRLRAGRPLTLDIQGRQRLRTFHGDVMLEAAATSFQIHLQVAPEAAVRFYNAALILSAPMVAVSANSPYLFGRDLWDETRIPLFEQAVSVCAPGEAACGAGRVTFGHRYLQDSLLECFQENLHDYRILLPELFDAPPGRFEHLRMHNGTIWRWNRPLIGLDDDGVAHLRIEHRVVPAGPSLIDTVANAALYYGLVHALAGAQPAPETRLGFAEAKANFYAAARDGLRANLTWLDGRPAPVRGLLADVLLPQAAAGLTALGIDAGDIDRYLGVIAARVKRGRNGAAWQRAFVEKHGPDMARLTRSYNARQREGAPVHEWGMEC
ncbi:MAG TPA: glutamate-cysteine ligase family protein [Acidiferrobacterales bacterium]